jgi:hypothetical protein
MGVGQIRPVFYYRTAKRGRKPLWEIYESFIEFVLRDLDLPEFNIGYNDGYKYDGLAYENKKAILINRELIQRAKKEFEQFFENEKGNLQSFFRCAEVIAHELRHHWQYRNNPKLLYNKQGVTQLGLKKYNEKPQEQDANGYAHYAVETYYGKLFRDEVKVFTEQKQTFVFEKEVYKLKKD